MDPMTLNALVARAEQTQDAKRVSFEPLDGYVLNPWSGLYQETDATYVNRLATEAA
ncbi:MAG TPA: hypothetical protein VL997_06030 [Dyella sp.]|nr:hypothetical protein [Dyella sp.]